MGIKNFNPHPQVGGIVLSGLVQLICSYILQCNSYAMAGGNAVGVVGGRLLSRLTRCHTQPTPGNLMS